MASPGFMAFCMGALRSQASRSLRFRHFLIPPRVWAQSSPSLRQASVSLRRLNLPPANIVRLMRWVRFGAAPDTWFLAPDSRLVRPSIFNAFGFGAGYVKALDAEATSSGDDEGSVMPLIR